MPEITHRDLDKHLKSGEDLHQTILIFGDSCLADSAMAKLMTHVFKGKDPGINYEKADGLSGIGNAIEFLMTRSFFPGPKLVCITDAKIFESKEDLPGIIAKSKQAFDKDDKKRASKFLLKFIVESGLDLASITSANFHEKIGLSSEDDWAWGIINHIRQNGITADEGQGDSSIIEKTIAKGLPKNHFLVLICDSVDKRKAGYKKFSSTALIVNCQIPKGDRKADKDAQDVIFREKAAEMLGPLKKSLDSLAFMALRDMTGDDLRVFSENLKLLADFSGERQKITKEDVNNVLARTKQDPIYEFTNSLASRDLESSIFFMRSILDSGAHPLQILASMINLVRRLLVVKSFCDGQNGRAWRKGMSYNDFQNAVMPSVTSVDSDLTGIITNWLSASIPANSRKAQAAKTDLLMAKGTSPYPLYLLFQKVSAFTMGELVSFFEELSKLDLKMKTSGGDNVLLIEALIIRICANLNNR
ncbi:DNA polymerase III subunit delta [Desulforegula conservatrix]|uniref:DNA polymerase III subunit delta n=1 Tax=Desulforegula conservatrix TaxID=153026 RepID=UPI0004182E86|nr:hypothetical protein [Desulforegula conservatrix]